MSIFKKIKKGVRGVTRGALDVASNTITAPARAVGLNWNRTPRTSFGEKHAGFTKGLSRIQGIITGATIGGKALANRGGISKIRGSGIGQRITGILGKAQNYVNDAGNMMNRITGNESVSETGETKRFTASGPGIMGFLLSPVVLIVGGIVMFIFFILPNLKKGNKKGI